MDNLTHVLAGAALGQTGLSRTTRFGMATLIIGANLPDVDVLAIPFGHSLDFRRGWTHGVLALVVLPFVLTALVMAWDRWVRPHRRLARPPLRPRWVFALSCIGVLSHPTLDWLNTYGVRWLMPFRDTWFYGDALFIIDPWVWLALGLGVYFSRKRQTDRPARVAVAGVALYMVFMVASSAWAERWVMQRLPRLGITGARSVLASPVPLRPLRRQILVETDSAYYFGSFAWSTSPALHLPGSVVPRGEGHPTVAAARADPAARRFLYWSRYPYFRVQETPDGSWVRMADARYSRGSRGGWASVVTFVPAH